MATSMATHVHPALPSPTDSAIPESDESIVNAGELLRQMLTLRRDVSDAGERLFARWKPAIH